MVSGVALRFCALRVAAQEAGLTGMVVSFGYLILRQVLPLVVPGLGGDPGSGWPSRARNLMLELGERAARPHQSRHQRPPHVPDTGPAIADLTSTRVRRRKILSGLISEYSLVA
jgi:hypothetical protein